MSYTATLAVAMVGVVLYFFGYTQGWLTLQIGGGILVIAMFAVFMTRKLRRR